MPNDYYRLLVPLFLHAMPHLLQTYATVLLLGRENYYEYIKQVNFILFQPLEFGGGGSGGRGGSGMFQHSHVC
jgi:hypothetical protein